MSILLGKNNWLVADWVMKLLFSDCKEISSDNDFYSKVILDIDHSTKLYTFLLKYTEPSDLEKIKNLQSLTEEVIQFNQIRKLKPGWDKEAFKVYYEKLIELRELINEELITRRNADKFENRGP